MKQPLNWTPAKVGCYWNSGPYVISTRVAVENGQHVLSYPKSGYVLVRDFKELGIFKTLKGAQLAATRLERAA